MPGRLHKIEFYISNTATGLPINAASVEVRRQGATVVSGGPNTFTINNPGGLRFSGEAGAPATDTVTAYHPNGTVADGSGRTITALSNGSITVGGPGFIGSLSNNDRLSPTGNLPTIYEDDEGAETKTNPLTTDSNGYAYCWAAMSVCDALANGRLLIDQLGQGGDIHVSNAFTTGTQVYRAIDTLRALATNDRHLAGYVQGAEKWWFNKDGLLTLAGLASSAAVSVSAGGIAAAGGIVATTGDIAATAGNLTFGAAAARLVPGATSFSLRNSANSADNLLVVDAGDVTVRRDLLGARRLAPTGGTALIVGDFALSGGWGSTSTITTVETGSTDTHGGIRIATSGAGFGAGPTVTLTFKDGTFTTVPFVLIVPGTNYTDLENIAWRVASTATTATFQYVGTPITGKLYQVFWHILK